MNNKLTIQKQYTFSKILIYVSMAFNLYRSLFLVFSKYESLDSDVFACYFIAIAAVFASITGIYPFAVHYIGRKRLLLSLMWHAGSIILTFSAIYRGFGVLSGEHHVFPSFSASLYFSTVTWTTLGYGDFQPTEQLQLLAAGQAGLGYLFLGLIVAIISVEIME